MTAKILNFNSKISKCKQKKTKNKKKQTNNNKTLHQHTYINIIFRLGSEHALI
jgi:hypothetical protein